MIPLIVYCAKNPEVGDSRFGELSDSLVSAKTQGLPCFCLITFSMVILLTSYYQDGCSNSTLHMQMTTSKTSLPCIPLLKPSQNTSPHISLARITSHTYA